MLALCSFKSVDNVLGECDRAYNGAEDLEAGRHRRIES